jgi:hypothetical protein
MPNNEPALPYVPAAPVTGDGAYLPPHPGDDGVAAAPGRGRGWLVALVGLAVLLVAGAGLGIHQLTTTSTSQVSVASSPPSPPASPSRAAPTSKAASTPTPTRSAPATVPADNEAAATAELLAIRAADLPKIPLVGQYVAQLASKTPGISDPLQTTPRGDHTFTAADILHEYLAARTNPSYGIYVGLLRSTDYGSGQLHDGQPLWVTFAAVPGLSSAADVNVWCAQQFPTLSAAVLADSCTPGTLDPPG